MGSLTAQGPVVPRDVGTHDIAFHLRQECRHPQLLPSRGSLNRLDEFPDTSASSEGWHVLRIPVALGR